MDCKDSSALSTCQYLQNWGSLDYTGILVVQIGYLTVAFESPSFNLGGIRARSVLSSPHGLSGLLHSPVRPAVTTLESFATWKYNDNTT